MKYRHLTLIQSGALFFAFPFIGSAQVNDVFGLATLAYNILVRLGSLFWILAVMLFVWGIVKFIGNAGDSAAHAEGKKFIVWGLIAFVVLTSLWGIVNLVLSDTFNITPGGQVQYVDKTGNIVN
ncbi:MAG: hypothetical protein A2942_01300 [Candidatus Lloydbacteria bacterium RIFCSPLOWO2_01_FULL_50_20]|uniref:Uncharacterized protein n=1 Tax=Candidatus Lloydbacteria bacterium RIFCSPLOWO2_01_FULL_50_20 TaxID=1798665 RepID=A0A1G2DJ76_9BACT|nr:MAG: hypothetical protein A3C13_00845 [Candidatus Lloydbacteria bacterium RIFCSPHIGHO2_02_FULL_50_11]OGZ13462.1 MAG: hypothetical protein A2942_01300 [Candidatus Lloydbacteria bacterium RIFCSPLOWO2_01_FULL_50_20]